MLTRSRTVPPALTLRPEVNLLTEFAVIATSPQSPLVREVSGENPDTRRREDDTPPPQLVHLKQMVCDRVLGRETRMPNLSLQFLFKPGCGCNTQEILYVLAFVIDDFVTKRN